MPQIDAIASDNRPNSNLTEWFAVNVRTGREHFSVHCLQIRGYEVFFPTYRHRITWSDRVKIVDKALFPGYLFCHTDPGVTAKIVTAPGVIRIVGNGCRPLPVAAHELEAVQRIVQTGVTAEPSSPLDVGDRVLIQAGPLRGIEGALLIAKNRYRLVVSISLLGRAVNAEIDSSWLAASSGLPAGEANARG